MTDSSIDEKRVYDDRSGETELFVTSELGVTAVSVSDDLIGEFSLVRECSANHVAADGDQVAVATDDDLLVREEGGFVETEFGEAVAVSIYNGSVIAADPTGRVAHLHEGTWFGLGEVEGVRRMDGNFVAAADAVYLIDDVKLAQNGPPDARDVAVGGRPYVATGEGLYYLGPGWKRALEGSFMLVAADGDHVHAATTDQLYEQGEGYEDWEPVDVPVDEPIVDVAYGEGVYAVSESGTLLVDVGDGWRTRSLGLTGVTGLAVAP